MAARRFGVVFTRLRVRGFKVKGLGVGVIAGKDNGNYYSYHSIL